MKITMYELLGMIKDGKEPKKIKYMGYSFEYDTNHKRYESYFDEQIWTLNDFVNVNDNLNDEVEILEEEKKIPEKIEYEISDENGEFSINGFTFDYEQKLQIIDKINEIIDYLDYLKSKGE